VQFRHYLTITLLVFVALIVGLLIGTNYLQQPVIVTDTTATEITTDEFNQIADLVRTEFHIENYTILEDFSTIHEITYVPVNLDGNHGSSEYLKAKGIDSFYSQTRAINYYNEQENILIMLQLTHKPTNNPRWAAATILGHNQVQRMNLEYQGTPIVFYSFDYHGYTTNLLVIGTEKDTDVLNLGVTFLERLIDFLKGHDL